LPNANINFRVDKENWIRVCEAFPDNTPILIRATSIDTRLRVVKDSHRHNAQETTARGFVRIKPKYFYDIKIQ